MLFAIPITLKVPWKEEVPYMAIHFPRDFKPSLDKLYLFSSSLFGSITATARPMEQNKLVAGKNIEYLASEINIINSEIEGMINGYIGFIAM